MQWRCAVCGYVHEGPEPPAVCPLCSAGRDQFEPVGPEPAAAPAAPSAVRWQCQVCGYIVEGDVPPVSCPVCGAPAERFGRMRPEAR